MNRIKLDIKMSNVEELKPYISQTFINYYNNILEEITKSISQDVHNKIYDLLQIITPKHNSVSKLQTTRALFYDLVELIQNINMLDYYNFNILNALIIGENYEDSLDCLKLLRENNKDKFTCIKEFNSYFIKKIERSRFNLIIYEIANTSEIKVYINKLLEVLFIILKNLNVYGCAIIKVNSLVYEPTIEILYLLSSMFEETIIIKPSAINITKIEHYIYLKNFNYSIAHYNLYNNYCNILKDYIIREDNNLIYKIIDFKIPYIFLSKLDEINIMLGQQHLELLESLLTILKSKNKEEKIELFRKKNIRKKIIFIKNDCVKNDCVKS